ncbi:MAG TPA: ABC transporter permease subunit [Candidatus Thermoplasmatota archaeon]
MIRAFVAEWKKVVRRGMLIGGIGLMIAFSIFAVSIRFLNAEEGDGPPVEQTQGPPVFTLGTLENPKGSVDAIIGFAGNFFNIIALVIFAQSVGSEYGWGTLRVSLSREPRRWVFLGGKILGMSAFIGLGIAISVLVEIVMAVTYALIRDVDMATWFGLEGFAEIGGAIVRIWYTSTVWGTFGVLLGLAFRSAAPAIGIGIGYFVIMEPLLLFMWNDGADWLPGSLLSAFNTGGTPALSLLVSGSLLAAYGGLFCVVAFTLFIRRDVSA